MTGTAGDRRGFSLIEMLLVVVIIGVLAQIVIPNLRTVRTKARAVDVMADINVVRTAAQNYNADNFTWPAETGTGTIPPELTAEYLPDGFSFTGEDYQLDWENLAVPGGLPQDPGTTRILGVAVVTDNTELGDAIVAVFGQSGWYNVGNSYVFIIDRQ